MLSGVRRVLPVVLTVLATTTGLAYAAAPTRASATSPRSDGGSDWGDGAVHVRVNGRMVTKAARTTTVNPATGPDFEMPFGCGQTWTGSSRAGHSPSYYSIDWNSTNDLGKPVLATAPGVVTTARSLMTSYGRYVVIDHGNGYSSLYGHLNQIVAVVGEYVDQGDLIGYLGSTGNSTGPHLHFEERLNGAYFPPYFHRKTFKINSSLTSASCGDRPAVGDWDGDGTTDLGIYRSTSTGGAFYQQRSTGTTVLPWGYTNNLPVVADFDGDRVSQVGVRRPTAGNWYLRSRTGATASALSVGTASDTPLTGDWDGNGRDGLGYYHPADHTFHLRADSGAYSVVRLGAAGDRPVVGDWNGDGKDDLGVFTPSTRTWTLRVPTGATFMLKKLLYAAAGDIPVVGDWNGDRISDLAVWRPATGQFILRTPTASGGFWNHVVKYGNPR